MKRFDDALKSQLCFSLLSPLIKLFQLFVWPGLNLARTPRPGQVPVLPGAAAGDHVALDALLMMLGFFLVFPHPLADTCHDTMAAHGGSPSSDGSS